MAKVSGGKGFCPKRNWSFANPSDGFASMFIKAWLWSVTGSSSSSVLGGMSVRASTAASSSKNRTLYKHFSLAANLQFFKVYSMADFKLKASTRAVSCKASVFPTERTSIPSVTIPTPSSVNTAQINFRHLYLFGRAYFFLFSFSNLSFLIIGVLCKFLARNVRRHDQIEGGAFVTGG